VVKTAKTNPPPQDLVENQDAEGKKFLWVDVLWLVGLGMLALLPPFLEWRKLLILTAIGVFQLYERSLLQKLGIWRGRFLVVLIKIILGTLLLRYSGTIPIISSNLYYIYYLPVISAAALYEIGGTLLWTTLSVAAYCSYLLPALDPSLDEYELTLLSISEIAVRSIFLFLTAIVTSRLVMQIRRQTLRYQKLAETLAETNRRLAQAREDARRSERLAALGQLTAGLAHEIRNPLGVIKGSAETLNKKLKNVDAVSEELTGFISSEVNRLNGLVSRFLHFARPLKIEPVLQDIRPVLEHSLAQVNRQSPNARIQVIQDFHPHLPMVCVDEGACEQVFTNLFSNAYEAMPHGGILRISAKPGESEGRKGVEMRVEDSGPGIPVEFREQIFNPFFTTKKEGVGLGLSIVSKIVDDHHGTIRISPESGKGACFLLFFPVEP
jgi:two-component system, NtrC family, sensor histidine kinase HydH